MNMESSNRRRNNNSDNKKLKIRNILNIIFMLLAIVGVIIYVAKDSFVGTLVVLFAMAIKMVECMMRMIK